MNLFACSQCVYTYSKKFSGEEYKQQHYKLGQLDTYRYFNIIFPNRLSTSLKIHLNNNCPVSAIWSFMLCMLGLFYPNLFPYFETGSYFLQVEAEGLQ